MKKILILTALLFIVPALAATVTTMRTDKGPAAVQIDYSTDSNSPTSFALEISANDGDIMSVDDYGTLLVETSPASGITISIVPLDNTQPAGGTLLKITIDDSGNVSTAAEDTGSAANPPSGPIINQTCATCLGDLSGDSWIKLQDWFMLKGELNRYRWIFGTYSMPSTSTFYDPCGDINGDGWMKIQDYYMLRGFLNAHKSTAGTYNMPCPPP